MKEQQKTIFSGIQPSGAPTIGNYLGALKYWADMQYDHDCLYCVVDLHSLTVRREPSELNEASQSMFALLIALGINPEDNILFYQSHVPEHTQLSWVLNCYTYMGELNRMTQFKEKSERHADNINAGLFTYPALMAADILLYQTDLVPVGNDQLQHLEITRDIAERFNNQYGKTFTVPEAYIGKVGSRIMGLQDPEKKMSKSGESGLDAVFLLDDEDTIMNKIKRAVTDSDNSIHYDPEKKAGVSNLISIYSVINGKTIEEATKDFDGKGYGDLKNIVAETIIGELKPIQKKYYELIDDKGELDRIAKVNAERARSRAEINYKLVCEKLGLVL